MKVSVIMPVYNPGRYLGKCLRALLAQTMTDFELLCVDDASTDGAREVLEDFAVRDGRIRILSSNHRGAACARNLAMDEARGDFLFFCDADDWMRADLLEKMVEAADRERSDIVVAGVRHYDEGTKRIYKVWSVSETIEMPCSGTSQGDRAFSSFMWAVWNKLFRRDFIQANHLRFQDIPRANDIFFVNAAVSLAKTISRTESCYYYRHNHGGNVSTLRDRFPYAVFDACLALREFLQSNGALKTFQGAYDTMVVDASVNLLRGLQSPSTWPSVRREIVDRYLPLAGVDPAACERLLENRRERFAAMVAGDVPFLKWLQRHLQSELVAAYGDAVEKRDEIVKLEAATKRQKALVREKDRRIKLLDESRRVLQGRPDSLRAALQKWFAGKLKW